MWVKVCGITSVQDAVVAIEAGADALGFVFAPSPRRVTPEGARRIISGLRGRAQFVGVFVDAPLEDIKQIRAYCGLDLVQLHGNEPPQWVSSLGGGVIKAVAVGGGKAPDPLIYPGALLLLDTRDPRRPGGTGRSFPWELAVDISSKREVIVAGGLNPENVRHAIRLIRPFGVDVSSGVEYLPGRKDHEKTAEFIRRAKDS